ncbi:hypothetical protein JCM17961_15410 [Endothiovibrio diazotrophicus]
MVAESFGEAGARRLRLVAADGLAPLTADPGLLRVALANLVDNALKYSPDERSVEVEVGRDDGRQWVAVTDRGFGIDRPERLFERYWRGGHTAGTPGAGLGLYLVRRIAEAHGGEVRAAARPGGGSRFTLILPES